MTIRSLIARFFLQPNEFLSVAVSGQGLPDLRERERAQLLQAYEGDDLRCIIRAGLTFLDQIIEELAGAKDNPLDLNFVRNEWIIQDYREFHPGCHLAQRRSSGLETIRIRIIIEYRVLKPTGSRRRVFGPATIRGFRKLRFSCLRRRWKYCAGVVGKTTCMLTPLKGSSSE